MFLAKQNWDSLAERAVQCTRKHSYQNNTCEVIATGEGSSDLDLILSKQVQPKAADRLR